MVADWHPSDGFEPHAVHLFIGASYTSTALYPMKDCDLINFGLHVIKHCSMYAKEYKNWISFKNKDSSIIETIETFKEYWAGYNCFLEPADGRPGHATWLWYGCHGQRHIACIVQRISGKLWCHIRRHA